VALENSNEDSALVSMTYKGNDRRTEEITMSLVSSLLMPTLLASSAVVMSASMASADGRATATFSCSISGGVPSTVVNHPDRGRVVFINWVSSYFGSSWPPDERCRHVSAKFQQFQQDQILVYIIPGIVNGQPVLCASRDEDGETTPCNSARQLFTLLPGTDPNIVIRDLANLNRDVNASPSNQRSTSLSINSKGETVLHVDTQLELSPSQEVSCGIVLFGPCSGN